MADVSTKSELRPLPERDFDTYITVADNAYPDVKLGTPDEREKYRAVLAARLANSPMSHVGLYRGETLLGGARLHDFVMNVRGAQIAAAGIGMVAVDLAHKKEHVARDLMRGWLDYCRAQDVPFALLYPFRPDFYKQMGFGYGTKMSQYRVRPVGLPHRGDRKKVALLSSDEQRLVGDCYARMQARTHGLIRKSEEGLSRFFSDHTKRVVGYRESGDVRGYAVFSFTEAAANQFLTYDLVVDEMVYESREALLGLLAFLRSQADQVERIVFNTQDDSFHLLLSDVRDGSQVLLPSVYHRSNAQGVGIMYRVTNMRRAFELLDSARFGEQPLTLRITVADSFLPENAGSLTVRFGDGHPTIAQDATADAEITLDVAEFSSLLMGAADFRSLHRYGLADISDAAFIKPVTRLFATDEKPLCLTHF
jgi:predicted acetyltransferase